MVSPPVLSQKVEDKHVDLLQLIRIRPPEKVQYSFVVVHDAPSEPHYGSDILIIQNNRSVLYPQI